MKKSSLPGTFDMAINASPSMARRFIGIEQRIRSSGA
jgi:hypothetical protein